MSQPTLELLGFPLGMWQTNCYLLHPQGRPEAWIIDAGFDPEPMLEAIRERNLSPVAVVLTHAHLDHIAGLEDIRRAFPEIPILIHPAEKQFLLQPDLNLSAFWERPVVAPAATGFLEHGQIIQLGDFKFQVRHTPGHSPGGICLYQKESNLLIAGDTLFYESIGRSDFPTSSGPQLIRSIRQQILTLPDETRVYPGHGPETTVGHERRYNPFIETM